MPGGGGGGGDSALGRVLRRVGGDGVLDRLARLPGADLTTLLLALMRRRAGRLGAPEVLRRYREDRFVTPASVPHGRLRTAEQAVLSALPAEFEVVTLAPVVPLGTHTVLGDVDQNNVLSTVRGTEVAADTTAGLALEAAVRRVDRRAEVRLAALQRVLRAQRFDGPVSFAHFSLLGLASAGRDTGNLGFERRHLAEHLRAGVDAVRACGIEGLQIRVTVLDPRFQAVADEVRDTLHDVELVDDPHREAGRQYYSGLCFKLFAVTCGQRLDIGDGGFLCWTQAMLADRKERLLTTGLSVERLALLVPQAPVPTAHPAAAP